MKRAALVQIAREEWLDDVADVAPGEDAEAVYSMSTRQLVRWLGEAERRACRSGSCRLIYDEGTADVSALTLVSGQRGYVLHDAVLRLDRVLYDGMPLEKTTEAALDEGEAGWRSYEAGVPASCYVRGGRLFLDRAPSAAEAGGSLTLQVWREPLKEAKENEHPEIPAHYHEDLVHWLVYRAKSRMDAETYDPKGASAALRAFEARFGRENSAQVLERMLESCGFLQHHNGNAYADLHRRGVDWRTDEREW